MPSADAAERRTPLSDEQLMNATVIVQVGREMGLDAQTITAALATSLMESGLRNLDYGDRDSLGLFQQRPSQGWGTKEQVRDPKHAARKFYEAYQKAQGGTVLERIANTQRPAAQYRDLYANHFTKAAESFQQVTGEPAPALHAVEMSVTTPPAPAPGGDGGTVIVNTAAAPTETRPDITADSPPEEVEEYIKTYYPDVAPFLGDDAIKMLLYAAAIEDWDERKLDAAIEQTEYWQSHTAPSRAFDAFLAEAGEAEVFRTINNAKGVVSDLFTRNGLNLADPVIGELAKQAIRQGYITLQGGVADSDGLQEMLAFSLGANGSMQPGDAAAGADSLAAIARSYLVPIDRATVEDWSRRIIAGSASEDQYRSYLTNLARGQWANDPDVVAAIDAGTAPTQFFAPHRSLIAETLELNPEAIDFQDPRWREVTQFWDGERRRAMTLGEVEQWARDQSEFKDTRAYKQTEAGLSTNLLRWLGKAA